jgi:Tfp pilus assembly protein PilO
VTLTLGKTTLSSRVVAGVGVALVLLVAAAGWLFVISPKRSEASDLDTQIADAQTELAVQLHPRSTAPKWFDRADLLNLLRAMPDTPAMPEIVVQLSKLSDRSGVTLDTITPSTPTMGSGYELVPMTVVVDGHFFAVRDFLRLLRAQVKVKGSSVRSTGRLFDVQAVDLEQTEPAPTVRASLTMQAFVHTGGSATAPASSQTSQSLGAAR